jgi:hypothetical protein
MEKHTYQTLRFTIVLKRDRWGWGTLAVSPKDKGREPRFFRFGPPGKKDERRWQERMARASPDSLRF